MQRSQMGQTEGSAPTGPLVGEVANGQHGMVATDAALATEVGVRVLQDGGNAADATIATAFAMAVVYPEAGNIGGGGFIVAHFADGSNTTIDFREVAPLQATRDMYVGADGKVTRKSLTGHLASGVPGAVAGLYEFHRKHGSKPWRELLQPAIKLAREGFVVDEHLHKRIADDKRLKDFPGSAALLLPNGAPLTIGSTWKNPDLANVLQRVADRGRDGFYKGETADLIVAEMKRGGGLISHEDLANYQAKWRAPIEFDYRGHRIVAMAPASSGGITVAIMAGILDGFNLKALGPHSVERYHLIAEASRRAFADRNALLGDPDFIKVPQTELLSKEYLAKLRAGISRERATPSKEVRPSLAQSQEGAHTTHLSFVDSKGNTVAFTTTLNELHGSAVTVTGGGFLLNDEMDDFTAKVGAANMFGLVQGPNNSIAPGKRMLSAMTPTIVLNTDGSTLLVTGARGGPRIISAVFQIISNVLDHGMSFPQALTEKRIHMQHLPDSLYHESDAFDAETTRRLEAMGHHVTKRAGSIGSATAILRVAGGWVGMADPRSGGLAAGY
ncbi:MAG TPA: gamma-glutamyltransferase [Longimicrobiales bacterium]|nr:gamma-glutamyltransferase [Longimicrobiales bacterium]